MMCYALVYQSIPPVISFIIRDLGISHTQAGLLTSGFAMPGIVIAVPVGILADVYGPRRLGILAYAALTGGALLAALSTSYAVLLAGRLLAGIGAMSLMVLLPPMLGHWFHGREAGLAMGVFHTSYALAAILAYNVYSYIGAAFTWHTTLFVSALIALVGGVLYGSLARPLPSSTASGSRSATFRADWSLVLRRLWPLALSWFWLNAAMLSMFTFTPDALIERGWTASAAGRQTSMVLWPAFFLTSFAGVLIDRTQRKLLFIVAGGGLTAIAILGLATPAIPVWTAMLIMGLGISFFPSALFSLPIDLVPPRALNLAFALLITFQNLGVTLGPFVSGRVRDATGAYTWPYLLMTAYEALAPLSALAIVPIRRRVQQERRRAGA